MSKKISYFLFVCRKMFFAFWNFYWCFLMIFIFLFSILFSYLISFLAAWIVRVEIALYRQLMHVYIFILVSSSPLGFIRAII
jgi:hypothetical protein